MGLLTGAEIQSEVLGLAVMAVDRYRKHQRIAAGKMPDLGRIDPMPGRNLAGLQEKMNAGHRPSPTPLGNIAMGLYIMTTLGMRPHVEMVNEPIRRHRHGNDSRSDLEYVFG